MFFNSSSYYLFLLFIIRLKVGTMCNYYYDFKRILFIWKCERVHIMGWVSGVGYGCTKNQAKLNIWK